MENKKYTSFVKKHTNWLRLVFIFILVLIAAASLTVPFAFETQTLWYKTGLDKIMLRAGQLAGMGALVLLFLQIVLSTRGVFLEGVFGLASLMKWHRINGVLLACLAAGHVLLVLLPEGLGNLPIGKKYWPEMVGSLLFCIILVIVFSSHFRAQLKLNYKKWKTLHQPLGYLVIVLVMIHVLNVSDSFDKRLPEGGLWLLFVMLVLYVAFIKIVFKTKR